MTIMQESQELIERAKSLVVSSPPTRLDAANLWGMIRSTRKKTEEEKETVCRPIKSQWDEAKKPFDAFIKECQGYETRLQGIMSAFDREQDRLAKVEQARLQAIADKANEKIVQKAEAKGLEPVLKVAPVVQAAPKSIETQAGTTQGRSERKVYMIKGGLLDVDASMPGVAQLLKDYPVLFELNRTKFNKLAATGMLDNHPNVKVDIEYVYSQRR